MQSKQQSEGDHNQQDDPKVEAPPRYYFFPQASDLPRRQQYNVQHSRHISDAIAKKHSSLQALLPAVPRLDQAFSNKHSVVLTQGQCPQPWELQSSSEYTLPSPAMTAADLTYIANYTPQEQKSNRIYRVLPANSPTFYQMPTFQHSQYELPESFQPWTSRSSCSGSFTPGSSSISVSPYLTPPPAGFYPESMQLTPPNRHILFSNVNRRLTGEDGDINRESESSSSASTPRKDRKPSDGPIIIKSDDEMCI